MTVGPGDMPRYFAFISYAHEDEAWVRQLHRRLERYRVPASLRAAQTDGPPLPRRLTPIFRDRDDMAAGGDLKASIRQALENAQHLIVICSPHAARSPWVNTEIQAFRAFHADPSICAVLLEGEPAESFPPALTVSRDGSAAEPAAADFRPQGDGQRLAFLRLVAGLLGVVTDVLVRRDEQRRVRRIAGIAAAAMLGMVMTGALAVTALRARDEAVRQRTEAEALVDFMLTDLRQRLKAYARLDVMDEVNMRALRYYERQDLARLPAASLERRAMVLRSMGEDDDTRGNVRAAEAKFAEAHRTTAALLAADPGSTERLYEHAQSEYWMGYSRWQQGDAAGARQAFLRYDALAQRLLAVEPRNPDWILEAAYAQSNLGTLALRGARQPAPALDHFTRARDLFAVVARLRPDDVQAQLDLADAVAWVADCDRWLGRYAAAREQRDAEAQLLARLRRTDPANLTLVSYSLANRLSQARIDLDTGAHAQALERLRAAHPLAERLVSADPANRRWREQRAMLTLYAVQAGPARLSGDAAGSLDALAADAAMPAEIGYHAKLLQARNRLARGEVAAARSLIAGVAAPVRALESQPMTVDLPLPNLLRALEKQLVERGPP